MRCTLKHNKECFLYQETAEKAMKATITGAFKRGERIKNLHTYECPHCKYWHFGHNTLTNKIKAKQRLKEAIRNVRERQEELDNLPEHIRDMLPKSDRFN